MENSSEKGEKMMINENGNSNHKNEINERENQRLRKLLQRAVNAEKAPDSLREKISRIIRQD